MSIKRILFSKIAPKAHPVSQWVTKSGDDVAKTLNKNVISNDSIHLKAHKQKPATLTTQSYPTQQYIDDMLQVGKYDGVEGIYDRKRCADALYGFNYGTYVEPVRVTSKKNSRCGK